MYARKIIDGRLVAVRGPNRMLLLTKHRPHFIMRSPTKFYCFISIGGRLFSGDGVTPHIALRLARHAAWLYQFSPSPLSGFSSLPRVVESKPLPWYRNCLNSLLKGVL